MKTKIFYSSLFLFAIFASPVTHAGTVEKCIDATGKITYTDKGCKGKETSQDAYLVHSANKKDVRRGKKEAVTTVSYKVAEIGLLTEEAYEQCNKQAAKYFSDSHPAIKEKPQSDFSKVVDRSIKGAEVEIILAGLITYKRDKETREINIQCTATKSREMPDWKLVYADIKTPASKNQAAVD